MQDSGYMPSKLIKAGLFLAGIAAMAFLAGCGGRPAVKPEPPPAAGVAPLGFTIQVGAFANMDNAVRLTEKLQRQGLNAYHFLHDSGLYKVRFGNFPTGSDAQSRAEALKDAGIIDEYYIVGPQDYVAVKDRRYGSTGIRSSLVKTAERYIGIPYRWGGESPEDGFDCSGFTMVVYQLNGLDLPRSSREQYRAGRPVSRSRLQKGDLVFFATSGGKRVSHVGIYTGGGKFLHASGSGRKIRTSSLSETYFKSRFVGARTYL
jgi:hypothetical protein